MAKANQVTKFDPTVEVALRLGVDPRKQDQMVRGTVNLPNGTGKTARVLVFATGDRAEEARAAGADFVGSDDLIERIQGGFLDFDAVVATPDLMGKVGRLGRVLGPRGLMPNPKTGTVTPDVAKAVTRNQGRQDRVPDRPAREPALHHRQGVLHPHGAAGELRGGPGRGDQAQARRGPRPVPEEGHVHHLDGPRHPGRPQQDPQPRRRPGRSDCLIREHAGSGGSRRGCPPLPRSHGNLLRPRPILNQGSGVRMLWGPKTAGCRRERDGRRLRAGSRDPAGHPAQVN